MTDPEEEILEFSAAIAAIAAVFPCPIRAQPAIAEILGLLGIF